MSGLVLHGEALIVPLSEWERILQQLHQFHQGTTKAQLFMCGCVFWLGINKAIEEEVWKCETCTQFQAQNAAAPLTPMPTLSCPWQMCTTDIFTLEGIDYLICGDFYSKMILVRCLPSGQSNTVKVISLLKEMFSEHGIPEVLHSDNDPQDASAQFTEFCTSWGITHETSSPNYLQLNGFTEACVKSVKHALQCAKHSGADPQLAPLVLQATPINAKLPSPAELLTKARFGPPFLPEFATLIWQPSRFVNELMPALMPPSHRQTNAADLLYPCMLARLLQCMTPSVRSGFPPLWYVSCQKTATKCAPVMAWSTTI